MTQEKKRPDTRGNAVEPTTQTSPTKGKLMAMDSTKSPAISRRSFLRGSAASAGLAAVAVTPALADQAIGAPAEAADPVFARYVSFLAHEHAAALFELRREHYERNLDLMPGPYHMHMPMFWMPDDPNVKIMMERRGDPTRRARAVLHAVGLPIPPQSWF